MYQSSVAIVGSGFMGTTHLEALRRLGISVAGVVGSSPAKAQETARRFGLRQAYDKFDDMLADDTVGAVHICVPNHLHYEMVKNALKAGKHVMCEKPLAMDSAETQELVALADASGCVAGVCYNLRYYPMNYEARSLIEAGSLGQLFHVHGCYIQDWLQYRTDFNWRVDSREGGALRAVADIGTHWMDMVQMITGQKIQRVFADLGTVYETRTLDGASIAVDTEDCANILFRTASGMMGSFVVSQVASGRKNTIRYEVSGADGTLAWNSEKPDELWRGYRDRANEVMVKDPSLLGAEAARHTSYPGGHAEGYPDTFKHCFKDFYGYIEAGDHKAPAPFPTFSDGHRELELCDAILKSHQQKRWIEIG